MTRPPSVLRSALTLLTVRFVLEQIGLALLVFLLYAVWLHIPDSSAFDVAGTVVLALLIVAIAGGGESHFALRLSGRPTTRGRLLRGTLLLIAAAALWLAWSALLDHLAKDPYLWAGYLNSRSPRGLRPIFSFEHIMLWIDWTRSALSWIGAGILLLFAFTWTASLRPLPAMLRALRSLTYWIALIVGTLAAAWCTGALTHSTMMHASLRAQMLGLAARLAVAVLLDFTVASLLLAILSAIVRLSDDAYETPTGTPDASQPRTVDNP